MCCNVYYIPFAFNAIISFVLLLIAGSAYSKSRISADALDFHSKLGSTSLDGQTGEESHDDPLVVNPAWFGPRLGRKKRSTRLESDAYSRLFAGSHRPRSLARYLDDEIRSVGGGGRWPGSHHYRQKRSVSFNDDPSDSPTWEYALQLLKHFPELLNMLRRESQLVLGDDQLETSKYGRGNTWPDEGERIVARTPPFSPRLGRRSILPLKPRLGRAGNTPEALAVFKPRLGRDPSMNEFSEYVDVQNGIEDKDH